MQCGARVAVERAMKSGLVFTADTFSLARHRLPANLLPALQTPYTSAISNPGVPPLSMRHGGFHHGELSIRDCHSPAGSVAGMPAEQQ